MMIRSMVKAMYVDYEQPQERHKRIDHYCKMVCKSRNHINIVNLIDKYENRFQCSNPNDWRLEHYLKAIFQLLKEEEIITGKLNDELFAVKKKAEFFHSLLEAQTKNTVLDKFKAINSVPTLISNGTEHSHKPNRTKTIHLKKIAKCEQELRQELFRRNDEAENKTQKLHGGKNFDDIIKYHKLLQENVTNEMIGLARSLKHNIVASNEIVKKDTELLERTNKTADLQYSKLRQNTNKIKEFADRACEYWLWISLAIVTVTFLTMVIFIRIF